MAAGIEGVRISINLQQDGVPSFTETENTTNGDVVFVPDFPTNGTCTLVVKRGSYSFFFSAVNFRFADEAIEWQSIDPENFAWGRVSDTEVAMSDLNFVSSPQRVDFVFKPAPEHAALFTKKIDPTIINDPQPGGGFVAPAGEAEAVAVRAY